MNLENRFYESELDAAVSEMLSEPLDQAAMKRVCDRALSISDQHGFGDNTSVRTEPRGQSKQRRSRWGRVAGIVGTVAASALFVMWLSGLPASTAIAQVVEHVIQIRSLQFDFEVQHFDGVTQTGTTMIQDDVMRTENQLAGHAVVSLVDLKRQQALLLDDERKLTQKLSGKQVSGLGNVHPIEELIAAKDKSFKSLGTDSIDGKAVAVFKTRDLSIMGAGGDTELTLWVDETTQLPVKIELLDPDPKSSTRITFNEFQWNIPVDAEKFAWTIPQDYESGEIVQIPELESDASPESQDLTQGVLFAGRVPGRVEIDRERGTVTALLRDQENATARRSNELRQWDLASGVLRWSQSVGGASDVAVCPLKNLLAVVVGKEIQLRDLSTGEVIRTWASNHLLGCLAFDSQGSRLAHGYIKWAQPARSAAPTGGVEIWNVETARLEHDMEGLGRVDSVEYAPSGKFLLASSTDFKCRLFNSETAELAYSWVGRRATFSPDGKHIAMVSANEAHDRSQGQVDLVHVETKRLVRTFTTNKGPADSYLLSLAFSDDGNSLAAGDWNGAISRWNVASGEHQSIFPSLPSGIHCVRFAPSIAGGTSDQLISGCEDATLRLHSLKP